MLLVLLLGAAGPAVSPAAAAVRYCKGDPIVSINGEWVSIDVAVPVDELDSIVGRTVDITVVVPEEVEASLVSLDPTYFNENVRFVHEGKWNGHGDIQAKAIVNVPTTGAEFDVFVYVVSNTGKTKTTRGESNSDIEQKFKVKV